MWSIIFDKFIGQNEIIVDWSPGFEKMNTETDMRPKSVIPKRETPSRPVSQSYPPMNASASAPQNVNPPPSHIYNEWKLGRFNVMIKINK